MRYAIPECNIEALEKKLTRIRNKCEKYGCEFKYERLGEHIEERTFYEYGDDGRAISKWKELVKFIDIEASGTAVVNGWRFAASLDFTDQGNIISSVGGLEIPQRYYSCAPWCEHCKTARDRRHSYIVYNEESGEFKQVGKACLKDFTGGLSAENAASFESFFKECEEASEFRGLGGFGSRYYDLAQYMVCVAETIRLYGYFKRDGFNLSTADRALEIYRVLNGYRVGKQEKERFDDAERKGFSIENEKSAELAKKVREWVLASEREDNYFHNLKVACALEYGDYKCIGLLASAFPTYDRELEFEAERKAKEAKEADERARSSWIGNVGDKVSFEVADFSVISSWETQWGTTTVFKFVSKDGLVATWKTSGWYTADEVIGKVLRGTVKEQKEYRGVKQTELTRCRVA